MPDNHGPGMIEDFLLRLAPPGDPLVARAREVVEGLPERRFKPAHASKAALHTWLAWQAPPGERPGLAYKRRLLDPSRDEARRFTAWLRELFVA